MLGTKILEEVDSVINGHLRVVKDLVWGTYIQAEGLTQSGGVINGIWGSTLKNVASSSPRGEAGKQHVARVLILGLGGGTAANFVRKYWPASRGEPETKIIGVDVDPIIVELGIRHLALGNSKVEIKIQDAEEFLSKNKKRRTKYDLILVDLYQGYEIPEKFQTKAFLELVLGLLSKDGFVVFNRLYFAEKRSEAMKFGQKLEKIFPKVEYFYPETNLMFICYN